ncbi:acyl-CoA dehydrogenase family protein [Arthrobacter sp. W4I7]|uniref:acyl-CoA dehydrogenase family protein n=1 Tax=Arthrobacter sp. W4I7 TaxID=3042296 RepID=UPI0027853DAF|nr:acyl-CoA dehydrogenase family protein [Arthrobacter sp. W4I7]MDQ0691362.1 alkylation response protein AidB-like acyl-CoA dehydrogenase [Arthrobacter sp. W4I7]
MDYEFSSDEEQFRLEMRALIAENMSPDYPGIFVEDPQSLREAQAFSRVLGAKGLLTRAWPARYGGQDAPLWSQVVFNEEMWSHNEPRGGQYMGVTWIGPALMIHGTEEQRRKHLPLIARGEVQWCQGFSEPDAGSDLASLRTSAHRQNGSFRVNGQKIWTSYANHAQYCVLATRTSSDGPKQHGITVFLVPMDRAGITVRPIDNLLGPNHLHEVYFDDVEVYDDEILGELDEGWRVMTAGLAYERVGIPRYARSDRILAQLRELTDDDDAPVIAASMAHTLVARLLAYRVISTQENGEPVGVKGSIARVMVTQLDQEVADVAMDLLGTEALATHEEVENPAQAHMEHHWRYAQASTVASGALEIQKMLIGRALLAD